MTRYISQNLFMDLEVITSSDTPIDMSENKEELVVLTPLNLVQRESI